MTTQYTPTLKLALPVTGELSGTWGDVVNDNITSMIEQAIAGLATINTWTANAHTLTTANGTTSESRCAMLVAATGSGGTAITGAGEIICPAAAKLYVVQNNTSYAVTLKTSAGTGVAVAAGDTAFLFCDGTNVNSCVTTIVNGHITGNLTVDGNATINGNTTLGNATSDTVTVTARVASNVLPSADNTYDLGSTGNSWKDLWIDGTATMALVAISGGTINGVSIGATTPATFIAVDNLSLNGNTIASTDTNGNIVIAPNGTGDVQLDADTVRVGDAGAAVTLTSNGAGALTVTTGGAADLTLSTNSGTTSGTITIANGANGNITLTPDGTGDVILSADRVQIGDANTDATLTTNGTGNLNLTTNNGTNSGTIQIAQGANGNITLTPNGTGSVSVPKLVWSNGTATRVPYLTTGGQFTDDADMTFDGTTLTVGGLSTAGSVTLSGGTANGVMYLNGSKVLTTGSALTFDGTNLGVGGAAALGKVNSLISANTRASTAFGASSSTTSGYFFVGQLSGTTTSDFFAYSDASSTQIGSEANKPLAFYTNNTEGMRLTPTGLGIGTSSPTQTLDVNGNVIFRIASSTTSRTLGFTTANGVDGWTIGNGVTASANQFVIYSNTAGAARMLIDSSGNVGIGTSSPNKLLTLYSSTNDVEVLRINTNGGAGGVQAKADIGFGYYDGVTEANAAIGFEEYGTASAGGNLLFKTRPDGASASTRPTERMRISSAGKVGIGTDAPDLTLDVYGDNGSNGDAYRIMVLQTNNAAAAGMGGGIAFGGYYGANRLNDFAGIQGFKENSTAGDYAGALRFTTRINGGSPTERMRISSAGNVAIGSSTVYNGGGFGTVLSIYNSTAAALSYANASRQYQAGINSSNRYGIYDATASVYRFVVATDGSVGIGVDAPSIKLQVSGSMNVAAANFKSVLSVNSIDSQAADTGAGVTLGGVYSGSDQTAFAQIAGVKENSTSGNYAGALTFYSRPNGDTLYERARITSTGRFAVGTNNPSYFFQVQSSFADFLGYFYNTNTTTSAQGIRIVMGADNGGSNKLNWQYGAGLLIDNPTYTTSGIVSKLVLNTASGGYNNGAIIHVEGASGYNQGQLVFSTGWDISALATERMRIDTSGNLLVGMTSYAGGNGVALRGDPSSPYKGSIWSSMAQSTNSYTSYELYSSTAAAYRFYVGCGGTVYATNTTISAISDIRFKENIRDLDVGLDAVMALKPRLYDWKEGKGANTKNARGFIAQEFEEVFPDLIDEWKDPAPEGEEPYKSVRQDLIPVLVKAMQEQQAIINQLKARLDAANL